MIWATFKSCSAVLAMGLGAALAGCANSDEATAHAPAVPAGAMMVASGNKTVAYTAPHDGKAYLRDDTDNRVIYTTVVRKNQVVKYDPAASEVVLDNSVAADRVSGSGHDHSWYFERSQDSDRAEAGTGSDVIQVPVGVKVQVQPQQDQPTSK